MVATEQQAPPAGPLELLLRAEAEQRRCLRARTLERAVRCGGSGSGAGLSSPCRSPGAESEGGRRASSFMDPTWLSAFRKMEVVDRGKLDEAEVAVLGIAEAVPSDGGSTRIGSAEVGSATMSETVGTGSSCSDGMTASAFEEFYRRSETFLEEREQFLDILRRQKEESDFQECTFEPKLSASARGSQASLKRPASATRNSEALYRRGVEQQAKKEERMQKMRQQKADAEVAECSFKPSALRRPSSCPRGPSRPKADSAPAQRSTLSAKGGPSRTSYAAAAVERRKGSELPPSPSHHTPEAQEHSVTRPRLVVRQSADTCNDLLYSPPCRVRPMQGANSHVQPFVRGASVSLAVDKMEGMLKGLQAC